MSEDSQISPRENTTSYAFAQALKDLERFAHKTATANNPTKTLPPIKLLLQKLKQQL